MPKALARFRNDLLVPAAMLAWLVPTLVFQAVPDTPPPCTIGLSKDDAAKCTRGGLQTSDNPGCSLSRSRGDGTCKGTAYFDRLTSQRPMSCLGCIFTSVQKQAPHPVGPITYGTPLSIVIPCDTKCDPWSPSTQDFTIAIGETWWGYLYVYEPDGTTGDCGPQSDGLLAGTQFVTTALTKLTRTSRGDAPHEFDHHLS